MRIVFIGTVIFSELMLEQLIQMQTNVVGVLTRSESKVNSDFRDLKPLASSKEIDCKHFTKINDEEILSWIKGKRPDVIFCFGLSQIIRKPILEIAPLGVVGYHPTLLPQNRGRHPLIWAIALGLRETGSTFFFMDEGADSGDILSQEVVQIKEGMNSQSLYDKIVRTSLEQVKNFVTELQSNTFKRIKQDQSKANSWRKRSRKDGIIDFRMDATNINQLILALSKPYVGASIEHDGNEVKVWESKVVIQNSPNIEAGKVIELNDNAIVVKCGRNAIALLHHEFNVIPKIGEYL